MVNLTLNDPVETFWDVRFTVTVSNNGTDILQTSPSYMPQPYRLFQSVSVTLTGFELSPYLDINNMVALNGYVHAGLLPEGLNSICIEVLDYNRQDVLLSQRACGSGYAVLNDPPILQQPACDEKLNFQPAQNILFNWFPMHIGSPNPVSDIQYLFRLVRVENGYNQFEAMEAASPIIEELTPNVSLVLQSPILEPGYTYAWQVQAVDGLTGDPVNIFKNGGKSVVCSFDYEEDSTADLSILYNDSSGVSQCGASCQANIPTNSSLRYDLEQGDLVKVGKFYMKVTDISTSAGGFYTGKGYVFIPFLLSNMSVSFTDLTVNTDDEMYSGDVQTDSDTPLLTSNYSDTEGTMAVNASEVEAINDYVNSENRTVSSASGSSSPGSTLGLPFAIDQTIGGVTTNLIITGIKFEKDVAHLNAVLTFGSQSNGDLIAFGGTGICFQPFGIGGGTAQIYLYQDFSLGSYADIDLTFKAPGNDNPGTYVTFDCDGFVELNIEGEYDFPTDMLVAADGSGDTVTATFNITTTEWGQFIASLDMDDFEVYGVDGYSFQLQTAYLDFSDVENPDDMEFPEDYADSLEDWKGFYLSALTLSLPDDISQASGNITLGVENVLIDHSGVSGSIFATEIVELNDGQLGEWAFSIDTVQIDFVSNSLTEGNLLGQIHIPIMDDSSSLDYDATIAVTTGGTDLYFTIQPENDISVSMWAAEMTLLSTSVVAVEKTNNGFTPYAELNGDVSISTVISGSQFDLQALGFEGLKINHPSESSRIAVDAFELFGQRFEQTGNSSNSSSGGVIGTTPESSGQESVAGFPISFQNVSFTEGTNNEAAIGFDLILNLTGNDVGIGGEADISVEGIYNPSGAPFNAWQFSGVSISTIVINAEIPGADIYGSLEIYEGDNVYGDGFKGLLSAEFTAVGRLDALAQFGKVNGYRYFFVDAKYLSNAPLIDILGVGLYGFGGGIWHHMTSDMSGVTMDLAGGQPLLQVPSNLGVSLSGIQYVPNNGTLLGLKATIIAGIQPSGTTFSADATFGMEFGVNNGYPVINKISFQGDGYFMAPGGSILNRDQSEVTGTVYAELDITDIEHPILDAYATINFNKDGVVEGNGNGHLHFKSTSDAYIWVGQPSSRVNVLVANTLNFGAYACMGTQLPAFPSPSDVIPGYNKSNPMHPSISGSGLMFGASLDMPSKSYHFGPFYASASFGLGFDAALLHSTSANCTGVNGSTFGVDGWYLQGQAYAYGSASLGMHVDIWFYEGDVHLVDVNGYLLMQAKLPNPYWFKGELHAHYSVLSGAVKGNVDFEFQVGRECQVTVQENPIAGLTIITDMSPDMSATNVSVMAAPAIAVNIAIDEAMSFAVQNGSSYTTEYYRPVIKSFTLKKDNGSNHEVIVENSYNGKEVKARVREMMEAQTYYTATATVKWQKKTGNNWVDVADAEEQKSVRFKTGDKPLTIGNDAIAQVYPKTDARNIFSVNYGMAMLLKTESWDYLVAKPDYDYYLVIEDVTTGEKVTETQMYSGTFNGYTLLVGLDANMNSYFNNRKDHIINARFVGRFVGDTVDVNSSSGTQTVNSSNSAAADMTIETNTITNVATSANADLELFDWYFRRSFYNSSSAKVNDIRTSHVSTYNAPVEYPYNVFGITLWTNWDVIAARKKTINFKTNSHTEGFDAYEQGLENSAIDYISIGKLIDFYEMESWSASSSSLLQNWFSGWVNNVAMQYQVIFPVAVTYQILFNDNYSNAIINYLPAYNMDVPRFAFDGTINTYFSSSNRKYLTTGEKSSGQALNGYTGSSTTTLLRLEIFSEQKLNSLQSTLWNSYSKVLGVPKGTFDAVRKGTMRNTSGTLDGAKIKYHRDYYEGSGNVHTGTFTVDL